MILNLKNLINLTSNDINIFNLDNKSDLNNSNLNEPLDNLINTNKLLNLNYMYKEKINIKNQNIYIKWYNSNNIFNNKLNYTCYVFNTKIIKLIILKDFNVLSLKILEEILF